MKMKVNIVVSVSERVGPPWHSGCMECSPSRLPRPVALLHPAARATWRQVVRSSGAMRGLIAAVVATALASGCGIYGVRLRPPPEAAPPTAPSVADLSVSLGEVEAYVNGERAPLDPDALAAIDARFLDATRRGGAFTTALPRGSTTDLVCDVTTRVHSAPMTFARSTYLFLIAPLALVTPGFPHPWDYRVEREVRVWGRVSGTSIPLRRERVVYDERIWGASYWGGFAADPLRPGEGEYIYATLARATAAEPALFQSFAAAARAGDLESAWLVGERARAAASAF